MCMLPIVAWLTLAGALFFLLSSLRPCLTGVSWDGSRSARFYLPLWWMSALLCGSLPLLWARPTLLLTRLPRFRPPPLSARNRRRRRRRAHHTVPKCRRRRRLRARSRSHAALSHLPRSRSWTWLRLRQNVLRLGLLTAVLLLTGNPLWPIGICVFFLVVQEVLILAAGHLASPRLCRLVPHLGRLTRMAMLLAAVLALTQLASHDPIGPQGTYFGAIAIGVTGATPPSDDSPRFDPADERLGAALAYSHALRTARRVKPRLVLKDGTLSVILPDTTTLELPAHTQGDQRLAMVIARLIKNDKGRPLFGFKEISTVFGKKLRQDSQNHMRQFHNLGGSLVLMCRLGSAGRPRTLSPALEKRVASFWERDPLATPEMCHQWLAAQSLPAGTELPSVEYLARLRYVPGNLATVRHSMARLFTRKGEPPPLRREPLLSRLFEVIDAQDRALEALKGPPVLRPGVVNAIAQQVPESVLEHTRTSKALVHALSPLTTVPSELDDLALMNQVGLKELPALHCATLYCSLRLSIGQISALVGHSKSVVYRALVRFARAIEGLDLFPPAQHFSGVLGLDEKWLKIPKSYSKEERLAGKKWRYAHFAVDARTGDLLHVDVYEKSENDSARAFLVTLRAMGIRPRVVVTDMWAGYEGLIRDVFGERVIHHFCLFHHLQAVRERLRQKCGQDWKQSSLLRKFVAQVDHIYHCKDRRTAKKRLDELMTLRPALQEQHPEALPLLELIEERFPKVANALGTRLIPSTNNVTERTIRTFNQHYKNMAGLESLETARIQLVLFRFFYRLTPQREMARKEDRNTCPVQRARWDVRGIPVADYIRSITEALVEDPSTEGPTASRSPPDDEAQEAA